MGRDNLIYFGSDLNGGINQAREKANINELEDALNVWAPDGIVQRRPGYRGMYTLRSNLYQQSIGTTTAAAYARAYDADTNTYTSPAVGALDIESASAGDIATGDPSVDPNGADILYIGADTSFEQFQIYVTNAAKENANTTTPLLQYWNGSTWASLEISVTKRNTITSSVDKLTPQYSDSLLKDNSASGQFWSWVPPSDWTLSTVDPVSPQSAYWVRVLWRDANVRSGSTDCTFYVDANRGIKDANLQFYGIWSFATYAGNTVVALQDSDGTSTSAAYPTGAGIITTKGNNSSTYHWLLNFASTYIDGTDYYTETRLTEASIINATSVFSTGDIFTVQDGKVYRITDSAGPNGDTDIIATVENRDFAVGPEAPYDKNLIAQLASWPATKYIGFHQNRLWAVTDDGVRWSAPAPYHNVWTSLAYEPLEGDNSATTGVASYNQNFYIFKQNSIYRMVFSEFDTFQIPHFLPHKVVGGTGCVAHNSIQEVNGNLVFLAEDGLKVFNGQTTAKLSERQGVDILEKFGRSISRGRRHLAASVNWVDKSLYLLSVATSDSATNNKTLVWDYDKNQFWIWEFAHDPAFWYVQDHDLFFITREGEVMQFNVQDHDHGADIEAYVESQSFGRDGHTTFRARDVYLTGNNKAGDIEVTAYANDVRDGETNTYKYTHYKEAQFGSAKFGVDEFVTDRERVRRTGFDSEGQQVKVKVSQTARGTDFEVSKLEVGALKLGRR